MQLLDRDPEKGPSTIQETKTPGRKTHRLKKGRVDKLLNDKSDETNQEKVPPDI